MSPYRKPGIPGEKFEAPKEKVSVRAARWVRAVARSAWEQVYVELKDWYENPSWALVMLLIPVLFYGCGWGCWRQQGKWEADDALRVVRERAWKEQAHAKHAREVAQRQKCERICDPYEVTECRVDKAMCGPRKWVRP